MGWLCSVFQDGCDFAQLEGDLVLEIASQPEATYLEVGFKAFREPFLDGEARYMGPCTAYPDTVNQDQIWQIAKGFAFFAQVLGLSSCLFLWFSTCCVFSRGTWHLASIQIGLAALCQACSFLWFRTDICQENTCNLFWGSKTDIAASVFWAVASVMMCCKYPEPHHDDSPMTGDGLERPNPRVSIVPSSDMETVDSPVRRRGKHSTASQSTSQETGEQAVSSSPSIDDDNEII